ncbi:MAG: PEP-CTERM sorting domain-containing protein [Sedimentisphaerales bacterium]
MPSVWGSLLYLSHCKKLLWCARIIKLLKFLGKGEEMKKNVLYLSTVVLIVLTAFGIASAWTTPVLVSEVSSPYDEGASFLSSDGLTLYFTRGNTNTHYYNQLYQATRSTPSGSFTNVSIISELACGEHETNSWVSSDNLHMYFARTWHVKESTRANASAPWGTPQNLTELNNIGNTANPELSADELSIVFNKFPNSSTGTLYAANRDNRNSPFTNVHALTELNTSADTRPSVLSDDGLTLYFGRSDSGIWHNYMSSRSSITGTFGAAQLLNYWPENYGLGCFSADGQTAYLNYNGDIYVSQIPEPVTLLLLGLGGVLIRKRG